MKFLIPGFITRAVFCIGVASIVIDCHATPGVLSDMRIVALSGQHAPGVPPGTVFTGFVNPVLNNAGQTAFIAGVVDPTSPASDRIGIWSEGGGNLGLVTLDDSTPPGVELPPFEELIFAFNDRGETALRTSEGIWKHHDGLLELVVGFSVPVVVDGREERLGFPSRPVINRHGVIAFAAKQGIATGMYIGSDGQFSLIADNRTPLPGTNTYPDINLLVPAAINSTNAAAFFGGSGSYYGQVWTIARGPLELLARARAFDYAPGETQFWEVRSPIVTTPGDVVFFASLAGDDVTEDDDATLWKLNGSGLRLLAREGEQVPGLAEGIVLTSIYYEDSVSPRAVSDDAGNLAFKAGLRGPGIDFYNQEAICRLRNENLEIAVQSGSQAPGTEAGTEFLHLEPPLLSKAGQIAFHATLIGAGIDSLHDGGIWAEDAQGNFQLIVREGDLLDLDPGPADDVRKVAEVSLLNFLDARGEDDQPYAFNNRGEIAFRVAFSDLTQAIVVSSLLVIPEPTASVLIGVTLTMLATIRRRARTHSRLVRNVPLSNG